MANFFGTTGNDIQDGTGADDAFDFSQGGRDTLTGRGGNDIFTMGDALRANDAINGGSGEDEVVLDGDYLIEFGPATITNVETLRLTAGHTYAIDTGDGMMGMGDTVTVDGSALGKEDLLRFFAHGENDNATFNILAGKSNDIILGGAGEDFLYGGRGNDNLDGNGGEDFIDGGKGDDVIFGNASNDFAYGGAGADSMDGDIGGDQFYGGSGGDLINGGDDFDLLAGGGGKDLLIGGGDTDNFVFSFVSDSTGPLCDQIQDFDTDEDVMHIGFGVGGVNNVISTGSLSFATFDADLAAAVNGTNHTAGFAVVFSPSAGDLDSRVYLVVDGNNTAGYQAGQDLVIEVGGSEFVPGSFSVFNFI